VLVERIAKRKQALLKTIHRVACHGLSRQALPFLAMTDHHHDHHHHHHHVDSLATSSKWRSPQCAPVLPLSISSILSFHQGHPVAGYVFFLVFVLFLSFLLPYKPGYNVTNGAEYFVSL
jgi:hypothetical protein